MDSTPYLPSKFPRPDHEAHIESLQQKLSCLETCND